MGEVEMLFKDHLLSLEGGSSYVMSWGVPSTEPHPHSQNGSILHYHPPLPSPPASFPDTSA